MNPLISICIPAYKNSELLERLLNSIVMQTFKNFELIITDDSPTIEVKLVSDKFQHTLPHLYKKNQQALGSPANWNEAISLAKGEWIKLMHHDDWFEGDQALQKFVNATKETTAEFIFSAYYNVEENRPKKQVILPIAWPKKLEQKPWLLFIKNYIGNPSTTLIKNNLSSWYDENLKWVVDFEFYLQHITAMKLFYIPETLVNVGIHQGQVTKEVFRKKETEVPENLLMLNKHGIHLLNKVIVYDYYWRFLRNLNIRKVAELNAFRKNHPVVPELVRMINMQNKIPPTFLNVGAFSKLLMLVSFARKKL